MNWQKIFLFWLLSFPFVVWNQSYEAPKIIWLFLGSFLLCLLWIFKLRDKLPAVIKTYDLFYFLWLASLIVASIFGVHPMESIIGGSYRHQGVLFFFAIWLVGKTIMVLDKKEKGLILKVLGFEVIVESILLFFKQLGTFGERNAAAGFLAITASLVGGRIQLLFASLSSILVVSRSAVLSLLPNLLRFRKEKKFIFLLIPTVAILIFVFIYASTLRPNVEGPENRTFIAKIAFEEIKRKPILGYGPESGEIVYDNYFKRKNISLEGLLIDRAHNIVLDLTLWSGIIGLTLFTTWFVIRTRSLANARLIPIISFIIFSFFQPLGTVHWLLLLIIFDL